MNILFLINKTKDQISWVSSHDLYWENKMYKRKRSIVSRSGYIWAWSEARDQESTNHGAHFVVWKSSYVTIKFVHKLKNGLNWNLGSG